MTKTLATLLAVLMICSVALAGHNFSSIPASQTNTSAKKRGPVFRANKDQIKKAQSILKQRGFYSGEESGKLDDDTRAGLRKYQTAEALKVTGTLNKVTLEKMGVDLTDKQRAM